MFIERRDKENNRYQELQEHSLRMIQQLSGNIWTDYNAHDPGITILDHLHYALYELQYVHNSPFVDYLKRTDTDDPIDYAAAGFFSAEELFFPSTVTPADYERLFTERIPEIKECRVTLDSDHTYLLKVVAIDNTDLKSLKLQIEKLYHANRNLCETLGKVEFISSLHLSDGEEPETELGPVCHPGHQAPRPIKKPFPAYSSIQHDFPDNYGINRRGKPTRITPTHEARILQLKGYLLIFDNLMAYTYRQLNDIPELLSFSDLIPSAHAADMDIEDIDSLVDNHRKESRSLRNNDYLHNQKARYLDLLDALYGENTEELFDYFASDMSPDKNRKRIELIKHFIRLNGDRFRSFNILDTSGKSLSAIEHTVASILDYDPYSEASITNLFSRYNLRLMSDELFFYEYKALLNTEFFSDDIERNAVGHKIESIPRIDHPYNERRFWHFRRQLNLLWHHVLFESFLKHGSNPDCYRMVCQEDKKGYLLLFKHPGMQQWLNMGFFFEKETLTTVTNDLWAFVLNLNKHNCSFYLVEHLLLDSDNTELYKDWHTLSIVIPTWNERYHRRDAYESLLQERLPAHLSIQYIWVDAEEMYRFEQYYFAWRSALAKQDKKSIIKHSDEIRLFIHSITLKKTA